MSTACLIYLFVSLFTFTGKYALDLRRLQYVLSFKLYLKKQENGAGMEQLEGAQTITISLEGKYLFNNLYIELGVSW